MPENRLKEITPYALRITASGALFLGAVLSLADDESTRQKDVFFWCSVYSSVIYMGTNVADIINIARRPSYVELVQDREMERV